jgi:hypothetical protein
MRKLFLTLAVGLTIILFVGCNKINDTVTITTDRNSYTPAMSSAQGITMTPNLKTEKKYTKLVYHWTANEGEFIGSGKEIKNQGEEVLWSAIANDAVTEIKSSFDIRLEVIDDESQKILASTKLTITPNNGFYEVKK